MRKFFPANVHPIDRGLRIVAGIGILSLVFVGPHSAWGFVGLIPLFTGLAGDCPLYTVLGLSTCPRSNLKTNPTRN